MIGINCSGGPNQLLNLLKQMREAVPEGVFSVMPNAGWPQQVEGRIMYPAGPEYFGDYALSFWREGASVIGGCCGTTPAHIASISSTVSKTNPANVQKIEVTSLKKDTSTAEAVALPPTQLASRLQAGKFAIAVEMDPPRGLTTQKLLAGASLLAEAGADVIDVADSPMARMAAAVADFTPAHPAGEKIKKKSAALSLDLAPTQDILLAVAQQKKASGFPRVTVGFAAESENLLENAAEKMIKKELDLLVANDISRSNSGFEVENNQVVFLEHSGSQETLPLLTKYEVAEKIIAKIASQIG